MAVMGALSSTPAGRISSNIFFSWASWTSVIPFIPRVWKISLLMFTDSSMDWKNTSITFTCMKKYAARALSTVDSRAPRLPMSRVWVGDICFSMA